jgi:hypothetical protein
LNFRFERVAANSFIQAAIMYGGRDVQFGAAITVIEKDFPMPFVDSNDDVFLVKGHSRCGMRLSTIMRSFRTQESSRMAKILDLFEI